MELSRKVEVIGNEEVETVVMSVCANCKRIQSRCKCSAPKYEEVTSIYRRPIEQVARDASSPQGMDPAESKRIFDEKMEAKQAKQQIQAKMTAEAKIDEEDEEKSKEKQKEAEELAKWEAEKAEETAKNVDEIAALRKSLAAEAKSPVEIKKAVKELQNAQKKRGRPAADAIRNPVKNPQTGEFEPSND
jgi:cysteinyl-tRNA synthetase